MKAAIGLLLVLLAPLPVQAQPLPSFDEVFTKIEARFEPATARPGETVTWKFTVELIPGWHTYPTIQSDPKAESQITKFKLPKSGDVQAVGSIKEPARPLKMAEPDLGIKELVYYEGSVTWEQEMVVSPTALPGPKTINVPVTIFACEKSCLPPTRLKDINATLTVAGSALGNGSTAAPTKAPSADPPRAIGPSPDDEEALGSASYESALNDILSRMTKQSVAPNTGLSSFLLTAAAWGLVTLFTPCVFPMIPITVSFFLKQAEKRSHANALLLALVYCGTIVVVLGTAALTLLQFFTLLSINPWMNVFLGALFVVLALSLFGMFDITLQMGLRAAIIGVPILLLVILQPPGPKPLWAAGCTVIVIALLVVLNQWIERAAFQLQQSTSARSSVGGIIGTVFMAISFTIVSFTCVAPFLGGFGGMAASGQFQTWELILGATAFSGTFAAPFFLLALFPSALKKLPKSGGWLNTVKVVMGFLELAAALKFFRTAELIQAPHPNLFTFDLVLGMWIALSLLCGMYLVNLFRIGHDEPLESVSVPRLLLGTLFISLAFYLAPAMFASGPDGEKLRPRGSVYAWVDSFLLPDTAEGAKAGGLEWEGDLKKALDRALAETRRTGRQKLVFVDFTGESCTNCKLNERNVFNQSEIQRLFQPYALVRMYTDKVPDEQYSSRVRSQFRGTTARQRGDAEINRMFQNRAFGTMQLPLYVILKPTEEGPIEVVGTPYSEGKINNVGEFAEFLKKPYDLDNAHAAK